MSAEHTLEAMKQFCKSSSGDTFGQIWHGNKATYHWNRGRDTSDGTINGVVRKLDGVDSSGNKIWKLAGSLKILPNGTITHFTGLTKKNWKVLENVSQITNKEVEHA
jgi:hypothetical protein